MTLTSTVVIAVLCIASAVPLLAWAFATTTTVDRRTMLSNLQRQLHRAEPGTTPEFAGTPSRLGALTTRVLPGPLVRNLDRLHARAGRPATWPMERILVVKLFVTPIALLLGIYVWQSAPTTGRSLIALPVAGFVFLMPEMLLARHASRRREQISLKLPDTMDQLSIAVEAGLGFEGALSHVSRSSTGPLSDEIVRTLQDIQVGVPRRAAYQALSDRVELPELRRFIRAIVQAEQHGVSIARVLNIQAAEMRVKRRLRAEEKAMRIPVMVAFPLFLFIFPALLVVVLGPAIINIIDAFTGDAIIPSL